jgi:hypothetical protein
MKSMMFIVISLFVLFVITQSFTIMSTKNTENQQYTVVLKEKEFEVRFYPATTIATINSSAKSYKELSGSGFRKLAGYIFGGNESDTKIAMTTPVHMDINDTMSSMSFIMPTKYSQENLPKPNDPNVIIKKTKDEYVAAINFGGFASDNDMKVYSSKLAELLKERKIATIGNFRYLGYNPPYQLIGRRNEIIVSVEWSAAKQ